MTWQIIIATREHFELCLVKEAAINMKEENLISWSFPNYNWVKLNVDGNCYYGGGSIACGGVVRDGSGCWITGFKRRIGAWDVLLVELWDIFTRLELAWRDKV